MTLIIILLKIYIFIHEIPKISNGILIIKSPLDILGPFDRDIPFIKNIFLINCNYISKQLIIF